MTQGPTDSRSLPQCAADPPGRAAVTIRSVPWWRSDPIWFWLFAVLFALLAWWPLVVNSRSGLQGGDIYTYFLPLKSWYAQRLQAGELPFWNPLVGHGFPALGESQTGVFYPFNLVLYGSLALGLATNASFVVHYVLAFAFTCLYVRRLGFASIESLLAAVVFVYGWFPARDSLEWAIVTGAWIPLALWGVEGYIASGRRWLLLATHASIVMQLLAGHFNLAFITLLAIAIYAPLRMALEGRLSGRLVAIALVLLLACGSAAIQLIPSWELKGRSQRSTSEFDAQRIGYGNIPWSYFPQFIRPWDFYPHVNEPEFHKTYFGDRNTNKVEAHLYFGLVPLGLAIIAIANALIGAIRGQKSEQARTAWSWLVIGVAFLSLTPGWWAPWTRYLPGFGYFTGPGRYGVLVQLAVSVLAALGLHTIRDWVHRTERCRCQGWVPPLLGIGIGIVIAATDWWTGWAGGMDQLWAGFSRVPSGWLGSILLTFLSVKFLIAAVVAMVILVDSVGRRAASALLAALLVTLAWIDFSLVAPHVRDAEVRAEAPIYLRGASVVRNILRRTRPDARVLARNQNAVSLCDVSTTPVYLGIGPREYFSGSLSIPDDFHWESNLSPRTLQWLEWAGVTHILAFDPMEDDSLELIWAGYDPFLHEMLGRPASQPLMLYELRSARGRAYVAALHQAKQALDVSGSPGKLKSVREIQRAANETKLSVECDEESVVVLTELKFPGWRALVDEKPGRVVGETAFRAVQVGPGSHIVRWTYWPTHLRVGCLVTALSGLSTCLFFWVGGKFNGTGSDARP